MQTWYVEARSVESSFDSPDVPEEWSDYGEPGAMSSKAEFYGNVADAFRQVEDLSRAPGDSWKITKVGRLMIAEITDESGDWHVRQYRLIPMN